MEEFVEVLDEAHFLRVRDALAEKHERTKLDFGGAFADTEKNFILGKGFSVAWKDVLSPDHEGGAVAVEKELTFGEPDDPAITAHEFAVAEDLDRDQADFAVVFAFEKLEVFRRRARRWLVESFREDE